MNIPVYNCLIDETDDNTGIFAMSFVDCPANEVDFIKLKKQAQTIHLNKDEKKQILTGVVLQPEQLIYRNSEKLGEHYIKFSAAQIEKIAQKMMKAGIALSNTTHQHQVPLQGNYLTELWIVEDPDNDKSRALGFTKLPKGTLMCSYKIGDSAYWNNEVMTGHVNGFSLEGLFSQQIVPTKTDHKINKNSVKMNKKRLSLIERLALAVASRLDIAGVQSADKAGSGMAYVIFTLADGKEVYVDADGFATLDEEQMAAGEHPLADGNILVIDADGQFVETKAVSEVKKDPDEAIPSQTLRKQKHRLSETPRTDEAKPKQPSADETNVIEALKEKIAEMEAIIDQLEQQANDAVAEVEELRKKTPSAQPVVQKKPDVSHPATLSGRMAEALSLSYQRRK